MEAIATATVTATAIATATATANANASATATTTTVLKYFCEFSLLSFQNPKATLLLIGHLDGRVEKADGQKAAVPAGGQAGDALVQLEGPPVHQAQHLRPALRLRAGGNQLEVPEFGRLVRASRHNAPSKAIRDNTFFYPIFF
jgi:hypothetical protein